MDPYKELGVPRDAPQDDIRTAFRRLARKHHPDMNPGDKDAAESNFKRVNAAYEAIGTPEARAQYDARNSMPVWGFGNFADMFFRREKPRGNNVRIAIQISLEEAARGGPCRFDFKRRDHCTSCEGTGAQGGVIEPCPHCRGAGVVTRTTQQGAFTVTNTSPCPVCHGIGSRPGHKCPACEGTGGAEIHATAEVNVPPGTRHGAMLRVQGQGEAGPGGHGDLYVIISVAPHDKFSRIEDDLVADLDVPFMTALLGGEVNFACLLGEAVKIQVPTRCSGRHEIVVPRKGINGGNLILRVKYDLPELPPEIIGGLGATLGCKPL